MSLFEISYNMNPDMASASDETAAELSQLPQTPPPTYQHARNRQALDKFLSTLESKQALNDQVIDIPSGTSSTGSTHESLGLHFWDKSKIWSFLTRWLRQADCHGLTCEAWMEEWLDMDNGQNARRNKRQGSRDRA